MLVFWILLDKFLIYANAGDPVTGVPKYISHSGVQCGDHTYMHVGQCVLLVGDHLVVYRGE